MWQCLKYEGELQNYLLADKTKTFHTPLQSYIVQFCGKFVHVLKWIWRIYYKQFCHRKINTAAVRILICYATNKRQTYYFRF